MVRTQMECLFSGQLFKKAKFQIWSCADKVHLVIPLSFGVVSQFFPSRKTKSSHRCFVTTKTFFVVLFRVLVSCVLFSLAKEPTKKKRCGGDEFADSHYCDQNLSQPIMIVLKAKSPVTTPWAPKDACLVQEGSKYNWPWDGAKDPHKVHLES